MKAQIISPTRNPMQSGQAKKGVWELRFLTESSPAVDPLMGWTGMPDTTQQLRLSFESEEQAIAYASKNNIVFEIIKPKQRVVKPKSYAANFVFKKENRA